MLPQNKQIFAYSIQTNHQMSPLQTNFHKVSNYCYSFDSKFFKQFCCLLLGKDILQQINKQHGIFCTTVNIFQTSLPFYATQIINPFLPSLMKYCSSSVEYLLCNLRINRHLTILYRSTIRCLHCRLIFMKLLNASIVLTLKFLTNQNVVAISFKVYF